MVEQKLFAAHERPDDVLVGFALGLLLQVGVGGLRDFLLDVLLRGVGFAGLGLAAEGPEVELVDLGFVVALVIGSEGGGAAFFSGELGLNVL